MQKVWRYRATGEILTTTPQGWMWDDEMMGSGKWNWAAGDSYEAWQYRAKDKYDFLYDLNFEYYAKSLDKTKGQ